MRIVLANSHAKLRIGSSILLKLNPSQVTKETTRKCSSLLIKTSNQQEDRRHKSLLLSTPYLLNNSSVNVRTFASSQSMYFWNKSTPEKTSTESLDEKSQVPIVPETTAVVPPDQVNLSEYNNTGYIPEPPPIIDESIILNAIGEPSLQSLGLASNFTPVGWVQSAIEFLHVSCDMPWYTAIAVFGLIMRACLFPITVKSQQNASKMKKIAPLTNRLREKLNEAKMSGDSLKVARATNEYSMMMKSHNIGIGSMILPILQLPFFVSAFIGIRKMCNLPVESLTTGGILWFENLTLADPFYILPTVSVLSILAVVARGIETGVELKNMSPLMKLGVFGLSGISFPFLIFMPAGIMVYFLTTNVISLLLSFVMAADPVKRALNIPIMSPNEQREIKQAAKKEKNFISGFKESLQNQKIISEVKERESLRQRQFERAGTQVPQKTYKNNPKAK